MKLTFYFFDSTLERHEDVFLAPRLTGEDAYVEVPLRREVEGVRTYLQLNNRNRPPWAEFVLANCNVELPQGIWNVNNSFVLVAQIEIEGAPRFFALTAGYGFTALDKSRIETDFGLSVTLNTVNEAKLTGVDVRTIGTFTQQKQVSINQPSEIWRLGMDPDQELVGTLEGESRLENFGHRIRGADSLSLTRDLTPEEIPDFCRQLYERHMLTEYRTHFSFVDRRRAVKKGAVQDQLNADLADLVAARVTQGISCFLPIEIEREAETLEIRAGRGVRELRRFSLPEIYAAMDELELRGPNVLFDTHVTARAATGTFLIHQPLFRHLVHEGTHARGYYVFSAGKWFRIDPDYVRQVNERVTRLAVIDCTEFLPPFIDGTEEGDYNQTASVHPDLQLMDKENFRRGLGGQSQIEVCDLLHRTGLYVCVKKFTGSADMSHLLSQGSVSATLTAEHRPYREFTCAQITKPWACPIDIDQPRFTGLRVVYAVICEAERQLPLGLPFFSKVNLLTHARTIDRLGIGVAITKLPIVAAAPPQRARRRRGQV